jgi:hypothetical protein
MMEGSPEATAIAGLLIRSTRDPSLAPRASLPQQTPEVPTPSNPNPDGACVGTCDCGFVPCGEYLFDHRNGSMLREWLLREVIGGPNGVDNPAIGGLFIDDFWCSNVLNGSCTDPVQGPTEIDPNSQVRELL